MTKKKTLIEEAMFDAATLRKIADVNARTNLTESYSQQIHKTYAQKLEELENEPLEEDEDVDLNEFLSGLEETDDEETPEEEPAEEPAPDAAPEAPATPETPADPAADPMAGGEDSKLVADLSVDELIQLIQATVGQGMSADANMDGAPDVSDGMDLGTGEENIQAPGMGAPAPAAPGIGAMGAPDEDEFDLDELDFLFEDENEVPVEESGKPKTSVPNDPNQKALHEAKLANQKLTKELTDTRKAYNILKEAVKEQTLDNAKLLYSNKLISEHAVSGAKLIKIAGLIDAQKTPRDVQRIYESLNTALSATEKKKGKSNLKEHLGLGSRAILPTKAAQQATPKPNTYRLPDHMLRAAGIIKDE